MWRSLHTPVVLRHCPTGCMLPSVHPTQHTNAVACPHGLAHQAHSHCTHTPRPHCFHVRAPLVCRHLHAAATWSSAGNGSNGSRCCARCPLAAPPTPSPPTRARPLPPWPRRFCPPRRCAGHRVRAHARTHACAGACARVLRHTCVPNCARPALPSGVRR